MRKPNFASEELFAQSGGVLVTVFVHFGVQSSRGNEAGVT